MLASLLVCEHTLLSILVLCVGPFNDLSVFVPQPLADSVPYWEAVANRRVLLSSTESREGLAQQVWHQEQHGVW